MSRQLLEEAKKVLQGEAAVKLDPVGQEDKDVDNDGDADKTDSYLKKRRGAISAAIAKSKNESVKPDLSEEDAQRVSNILKGVVEETDQIDEVSRETLAAYKNKASDARYRKTLPTAKVDKRDSGVAMAMKKLDKKNEETEQVDEMQVANKYALKGPQPAEVPAYMRKGNARKQFPLKLDDLKRKDTMSDIENLRKMEEVELDESDDLGPMTKKQKTVMVTHKTSGKEKVIVDTPENRKRNAEMGFHAKSDEMEKNEGVSHQTATTMKHAKNPTLQQRMFGRDIKPGVKGYSDRAAMLRDLEKTGRVKEESEESIVAESDGPVVWKGNGHTIEKMANDKFTVYMGDKKGKSYPSLSAAKASIQEELDVDSISEIIESRNAFTIDLPEKLTYEHYLKAAMQAEGIESLKELDDETLMPFLTFVEQMFVEGQEEFVISELTYSELQDKIYAHQKGGNKVTGIERKTMNGQPYAAYVVTDKSGMRRKYIYQGNVRRVQSLGQAQKPNETNPLED
jgi:hypothetical protein